MLARNWTIPQQNQLPLSPTHSFATLSLSLSLYLARTSENPRTRERMERRKEWRREGREASTPPQESLQHLHPNQWLAQEDPSHPLDLFPKNITLYSWCKIDVDCWWWFHHMYSKFKIFLSSIISHPSWISLLMYNYGFLQEELMSGEFTLWICEQGFKGFIFNLGGMKTTKILELSCPAQSQVQVINLSWFWFDSKSLVALGNHSPKPSYHEPNSYPRNLLHMHQAWSTSHVPHLGLNHQNITQRTITRRPDDGESTNIDGESINPKT